MSLFCCGKPDKNNISPPMSPQRTPPVRIAPKVGRRRSAPRPRASKKNIEDFYKEGKELLRAEQERNEREYFQMALRREYESDMFEEGALEIERSPGFDAISIENERTYNIGPIYSGNEPAASSRRRFSSQTATDRTGVTLKRLDNYEDLFMAPYEPSLVFSKRTQQLNAVNPSTDSLASSVEILASHIKKSTHQDERLLSAVKPYQSLSTNIDSSNYGPYRSTTSGCAKSVGSIGSNFAPHYSGTSDWAIPAEYIAQYPTRNNITFLRTEPKFARPKLELTHQAIETLNIEGTNKQETTFAVSEGQTQELVWGQDDSGKNELLTSPIFSPDDIIAHIPALVRPSTSTFMSLGSLSMLPVDKSNRSPSPEIKPLRCELSSPPPQKTTSSTKSLDNSLFRHVSVREYTAVDSTSSFYPSQDGSRCHSLQQSLVDIQATMKGPDFQVIPMQGRFSREFSGRRQLGHSASQTVSEVGKSPAFSKFRFPWNSSFARSDPSLAVGTSVPEPVNEKIASTRLQESKSNQVPEWREKNRKHHINPNHTPTRFNFLKKSTNDSICDLAGPEGSVLGGTRIALGMYGDRPSIEQQTDNSARSRNSWAKGPSKIVTNPEGSLLKQGQKIKDNPAETQHVDDVTQHASESGLGVFNYIKWNGIVRSKSMTLRKTLRASMTKIQAQVNISSVSKAHQSKSSDSNLYLTQSMRDKNAVNRSGVQFKIGNTELKARAMLNRHSFEGGRISSGSRNVVLRDTSAIRSMSLTASRTPSAARIISGKQRNTAYDECVIFPVSKDGNDDERITHGQTLLGVCDTNFLVEESDSESRFLRELRKQTFASRTDNVGVAT